MSESNAKKDAVIKKIKVLMANYNVTLEEVKNSKIKVELNKPKEVSEEEKTSLKKN